MRFVMTKSVAQNLLKAIGGTLDRVKALEGKVREVKALHEEHIGLHNMHSHDARIYRLETIQAQLEANMRKLALNSDDNLPGYLPHLRIDYPVVCICGSMRYKDEMLQLAEHLTEKGNVVLMPYSVSKAEDVKEMLDDMHRQKIDMATAVYVVGEHIGDSTSSEIKYARSKGKPIRYTAERLQYKGGRLEQPPVGYRGPGMPPDWKRGDPG